MTSKSLYFNLVREDMKRRVWTISLAMLAFVIALPIFTMLRLDRMKFAIENTSLLEAQEYFAKISSTNNIGLLMAITISGAIICGISGYFYLYSKSKVDSYHSIPVKREKLFFAIFVNGILIYAIPYVINLLFYFIIGIANGLITGNAIMGAFEAFFINLIGYLLVYSITIIAVMLTGNLIVGLMGTAVFLLYGPAIIILKNAIYETFFQTYYGEAIDTNFKYVSPLFAYNYLNSLVGEKGFGMFLIGVLSVTIAFVVLGMLIYKVRPSEAAGKSMAFHQTQAIIKTLIVIPTAIVGGLLFMSMSESNSFSWTIFGILFIGFLAHGIIEIIYNSDFKSIIANKIQLAICIIISLGIASGAKADVINFDSYLPNQGKIESLGVSFNGLEPNYEYFDYKNEYPNLHRYQKYAYVDYTTYRLDHVKIKDLTVTYPLIEYAIANNVNKLDYSQRDNSARYISLSVKYTLKNKKETYRDYTVKLDDVLEYLEKLYADENYKYGVYQIFTMDKSIVNSVDYYNLVEGTDETLKITKEQQNELLNIYENDLRSLTSKELLESFPVTQLSLEVGDTNSNIIQSYYIYPSFTNTIKYMESVGANLESVIDPDNIESITITNYTDGTLDQNNVKISNPISNEYVFTDKEEIEKITKALILDRFTNGMKYNVDLNYNYVVDIQYKYTNNNTDRAYLALDKLSEDIRAKISNK